MQNRDQNVYFAEIPLKVDPSIKIDYSYEIEFSDAAAKYISN